MSKTRSVTSPPHRDEATKKEINRQHALLFADMDKKQLRGNVTLEDRRHHKQTTNLTQREKREHYQIKTKKKEVLNDLKKVRSSYTGHYDETKSPLENIQLALRTKCQTPPKNSRLDIPGAYGIRKCKSTEVLASHSARASSSLSYSTNPCSLSRGTGVISHQDQREKERPKTAGAVILTSKRQAK